MPTRTSKPYLPSELILQIIDHIIPQTTPKPIALSFTDRTTKTLLSLTRTSRITYPTALRHLYAHCLWISSPRTLRRLLKTLEAITLSTNVNERPRTLPRVDLLQHITSLYLRPFDGIGIDRDTAYALGSLLPLIAPTLRRLVVDMPLRNLSPSEDVFGPRPILRHAFSQLINLEVFCSVRDELYLACDKSEFPPYDLPIWSLWPGLRTLALYNPDLSEELFWQFAGGMRKLETLVLTRSDGLEDLDMKKCWKKYCGDKERGLNIYLVNVESLHQEPMGREGWREDDKVLVKEVNVGTSYYGDEDCIFLCQEWVNRRMLRGEEKLEE